MLALMAPACRGTKALLSAGFLAVLALLGPGAGKAGATPYGLPPNAPAPPIDLPSLNHGAQTLAALQDKVLLVHFFATWREPCRDEMASLSRLAARMENRPFAIVAVDVGEVRLRVQRFFEKAPVPFPILLDEDQATMKAWNVGAFPTTYLLDPKHQVKAYAAFPVDWDQPQARHTLEILLSGEGEIAAAGLPLPLLQTENNGSNQ